MEEMDKINSSTSEQTNYQIRQKFANQNIKKSLEDTTSTKINSKIASLMIKVSLSKYFDSKQFSIISSLSPRDWIKSQAQLYKRMCDNKKLYDKHFAFFYKNHVTLSNWFQLAVKDKSTIEPYIFKDFLVQKKNQDTLQQNFKNQRLKQSFHKKKTLQSLDKNGNKSTINVFQPHRLASFSSNDGINDSNHFNDSENVSFMKPSLPIGLRKSQHRDQLNSSSLTKQKQQLMGVFFNNLIELNTIEHKRKPLNLKLYKLKRKENIDSHDLYMKTFDACNGRKYIFYDYQKHMKGLREKNKYNQCLRANSTDFNQQNFKRSEQIDHQKGLHKYLQYEQQRNIVNGKQKCSLLPINMVLNQKELNNYKGLKRVINTNKSSKVVFVNHQGKPITYYIKEEDNCQQKLKLKENKGMMNKKCVKTDKISMNVSNSVTAR